ncbi:zinc finger protein 354C-like [Ambystoma mexicanum]|uniref:zinc finger protein 354C-like n=1 Tax=Ambystoma mexicanum TaxID=8296 RepID=UPI0037E79602
MLGPSDPHLFPLSRDRIFHMENAACKVPEWVFRQASVTFHNVVAYFWEEEWERLEGWQQELYTDVMKDIHRTLIALGHKIANPDILFQIKKEEDLCFRIPRNSDEGGGDKTSVHSHDLPSPQSPDIFFRIKESEEPCLVRSSKPQDRGSVMMPITAGHDLPSPQSPDIFFRIKESEEPCLVRSSKPQDRGSVMMPITGSVGVGSDSILKVKEDGKPNHSNNPNTATKGKTDNQTSSLLVYHPDMSLWIKQVDEPELDDFPGAKDAKRGCRSIGGAADILVNPYDTLLIKQEDDPVSICPPDARAGNPRAETTSVQSKEDDCETRRQNKFLKNADNQIGPSPQEQGFSKVDNANPFQCNTCMKCFSHFSNFKDHHRTHTGEKPFRCKMCKKSFSHSSNLTQHMRTHTGEKPYACAECEKTFTMKSHLITHQRLHTGERPHACDNCGKTFTMKSHLITHQRLHTGERPYKCNECMQSYRKASDLVRHKRIHTGEKPYHCNLCEKRFNNLQCLKIHQRSHTGEKPYQCSQCEKGFLQNSDLIRHQKTHTGERPFQCQQCEKNFPQRSDLVRHEKVHAAERAHRCPECDKGFNLKSGLTRHRKLHMGMRRLMVDINRPSCGPFYHCKLENPKSASPM